MDDLLVSGLLPSFIVFDHPLADAAHFNVGFVLGKCRLFPRDFCLRLNVFFVISGLLLDRKLFVVRNLLTKFRLDLGRKLVWDGSGWCLSILCWYRSAKADK